MHKGMETEKRNQSKEIFSKNARRRKTQSLEMELRELNKLLAAEK